MKVLGFLLALCLLLSGCSAPEFEVLGDEYAPVLQQMKDMQFSLPEDARAASLEAEEGRLFFCDGYELAQQTFVSGDLAETFRRLTGYDRDQITVYETALADVRRYDCVWVSASAEGDSVHRAVILDDGLFHYCLSVGAQAREAGSLHGSWQSLFSSVQLVD